MSQAAKFVLLGMLAGASLAVTPDASASEGGTKIDFARDIFPLLQKNCFDCHGPDKQRGGLRLDSHKAALAGGDSGPALVAGKPAQSALLRRVTLAKDADGVMPARGEPLGKHEVDKLRGWIEQGAVWPADVKVARHWAYIKPLRATLPAVKHKDWPRTAVDHFVLARLERAGLRPSPEADRAVWLRRVHLDVIGLPPSPAEVEAFLRDTAPQAYEKVVDRLLASPHFGERWARAWLDLARYADSHGFQRDDLRTLWPYRDWVIKALNADMPFDRFTIEQLAGDLLPGATLDQKIATGFNRCAPTNVEAGSEPEETRVNQVFDRVNTAGAIWLGATLECAQCHDHKYDPFTQKEYYQLFAYFNNTAIEADRTNPKVPGSIAFRGPYLDLSGPSGKDATATRVALKKLDKQLEARRQTLAADLPAWEKSMQTALAKTRQAHVLDVADFTSSAGSPHKLLGDKSILLVDDPPDKDTYTVVVNTELEGITGFKLEALTHPSLPGEGPGRGDGERPNFVLNTFRVSAAPLGDKAAAVKLERPSASFAQKNFDVAGAIDGDPKSAWAINPAFHKPHWAAFETSVPLGSSKGLTLTFTLVQNFGKGRTIGRLRLSALVGDSQAEALPADIVAILKSPKRSADETARLVDFRAGRDEIIRTLTEERQRAEAKTKNSIATLVMEELSPPRLTSLFTRGDFKTPGPKVGAGTPSVLHAAVKGPPDRLTLARWLVDRDNPLAARVTVNRWWAEIFGHGIVATIEDFGIKGEAPTHPELLDWLAVEFMDSGWSMKKTLRHILLSATYRQSSNLTPLLREKDDQNRLYGRGPRLRLDAEMIRDNALAAAGLLSRKQFGPPVRPYQPDGLWTRIGGERVEYVVSPGEDRHRRGLYVVWKRSVPYPSFVNFDATSRYACTVKRSRSNTPLQALTLLNDPVYVEAALALAKRVLAEKAGDEERVRHAFRLCLARAAKDAECALLSKLLADQRAAARANPKETQELVGSSLPEGVAREEFAAWYAVATTLLNLDEMITKR